VLELHLLSVLLHRIAAVGEPKQTRASFELHYLGRGRRLAERCPQLGGLVTRGSIEQLARTVARLSRSRSAPGTSLGIPSPDAIMSPNTAHAFDEPPSQALRNNLAAANGSFVASFVPNNVESAIRKSCKR
jgi:hypothetical protein